MTPVGPGPAKEAVCAAVDAAADRLVELSHDLHAHPEPAGREWRSSRRVAGFLADAGLRVEAGPPAVPTAFRARAGPAGAPHVVVCCEYDALPGLGHACGHNVIAAAGAGAGLALAALAERLGGRVTVLGTPAEERLGGKIALARLGAFTDADAVLLVHPSSYQTALPRLTAVATLDVAMAGRAAHASLFPERGVNALDALVLGYLGVAALRQHLGPGERVHGIVTGGGEAPNIVPARAGGRFLVRAPTTDHLAGLESRVLACFAGGARAAGARFDHAWAGPAYAELRANLALAAAFTANAAALGRRMLPRADIPESVTGSTDLGNVSRLVPAIHPMLAISPPDVVPHTPGFAVAAASPAADRAVLDGAKAMAMTAIDVWTRPGLRAAMQADHRAAVSEPASPARRRQGPARLAVGWPGGAGGPGR